MPVGLGSSSDSERDWVRVEPTNSGQTESHSESEARTKSSDTVKLQNTAFKEAFKLFEESKLSSQAAPKTAFSEAFAAPQRIAAQVAAQKAQEAADAKAVTLAQTQAQIAHSAEAQLAAISNAQMQLLKDNIASKNSHLNSGQKSSQFSTTSSLPPGTISIKPGDGPGRAEAAAAAALSAAFAALALNETNFSGSLGNEAALLGAKEMAKRSLGVIEGLFSP